MRLQRGLVGIKAGALLTNQVKILLLSVFSIETPMLWVYLSFLPHVGCK